MAALEHGGIAVLTCGVVAAISYGGIAAVPHCEIFAIPLGASPLSRVPALSLSRPAVSQLSTAESPLSLQRHRRYRTAIPYGGITTISFGGYASVTDSGIPAISHACCTAFLYSGISVATHCGVVAFSASSRRNFLLHYCIWHDGVAVAAVPIRNPATLL